MRRAMHMMIAGAATLAVAAGAFAQDWPARPLRMVLSQPTGSSPDIIARVVADRVGRALGQTVVIENRPGGQNVIGAQLAAKAAPDGYTFYYGTTAAIVTNPLTFKSLPYDPAKDFVAVAMIGHSPFAVAVGAKVGAKSIAELAALDRAQPGMLAIANEGPRTFGGMMAKMLNAAAGMNLLQVQYNGVTPAIQDTVAGRTHAILVSMASIAQFLRRGDLRPLAVTTATRVPGFEDVPTMAESYPGFQYSGWHALFAPAGAPAAVVSRMNREVENVLADAESAQKLRDLGLLLEGAGTAESLNAFLRAERERWTRLVREANVQPE